MNSNQSNIGGSGKGFPISALLNIVEEATESAKNKLENMRGGQEDISITEMFSMQMDMNRLSQLSEMSTAVVSAAGSSIQTIARHTKGG
jgi:hypothetical protein